MGDRRGFIPSTALAGEADIEYIDAMLEADRFLQPPEELLEYVFNFYDWTCDLRFQPRLFPRAYSQRCTASLS